MWDSRSSDRNNQEQTYVWETLCKNLLKIPVSLITNFSATMQACELPPLHPLHLLTMVGRVAANSSAARVTAIVRSAAVAPLNTARGKGPLHAGNRIAVIFVRRQIIYGYYFWRQDCRMCITTLIFQATATLEVSSIWNFWECCQHSYSMWRWNNVQVIRPYLGVKRSCLKLFQHIYHFVPINRVLLFSWYFVGTCTIMTFVVYHIRSLNLKTLHKNW